MIKNYWSKAWLLLGLLPLLLIACGADTIATTPASATDEPAPPTVEAQPVEAEVMEEEVEGETAVSDEILPVSAKPQLIEFYADW